LNHRFAEITSISSGGEQLKEGLFHLSLIRKAPELTVFARMVLEPAPAHCYRFEQLPTGGVSFLTSHSLAAEFLFLPSGQAVGQILIQQPKATAMACAALR
jgi:hypothetical protein